MGQRRCLRDTKGTTTGLPDPTEMQAGVSSFSLAELLLEPHTSVHKGERQGSKVTGLSMGQLF